MMWKSLKRCDRFNNIDGHYGRCYEAVLEYPDYVRKIYLYISNEANGISESDLEKFYKSQLNDELIKLCEASDYDENEKNEKFIYEPARGSKISNGEQWDEKGICKIIFKSAHVMKCIT